MEKINNLQGVIPIIPTPFTSDEEIDETDLRSLIDFAASTEVAAVCLPAYASEFYKLSDEERLQVVNIAIQQSAGRVKIMGQCNSASVKQAVKLAQANVEAGVDVLSLTVPRIFGLPEGSIEDYLDTFFKSVPDTPVLIQDFNPGGQSISVQLIVKLMKSNPNFRYLKLEEPLCSVKFKQIIDATKGEIGLFEGWGGLYMLELIPLGIAGIMPGLGVSDILQKVYRLRKDGDNKEAMMLFEKVMPQIFFALQNMELFHYVEKELLKARGVLKNTYVRKASYTPDESTIEYVRELNENILALVEEGILK
ncbi:MAG: dihydrodipicolinate synthase family protein [Agriterribacter sp.]